MPSREVMNSLLLVSLLFAANLCVGGHESLSFCPPGCSCTRGAVKCSRIGLVNVPTIPPEAALADLQHNAIRALDARNFKSAKRLKTLLLTHNEIDLIQDKTFNELDILENLFLFRNKLSQIREHTFEGLRLLRQLYLYHNRLTHIAPRAFRGLTSLERLFLHDNQLTTLSAETGLSGLHSLRNLRLEHNQIKCDCNLLWLSAFSRGDLKVSGSCSSPLELSFKELASLRPLDLGCSRPTLTEEPKDVMEMTESVSLSCKSRGDPEPTVLWMHNYQRLETSRQYEANKYSLLNEGQTLRINQMGDDIEGVYECIARNLLGEAKSKPALVKMLKKSQQLVQHNEVKVSIGSGVTLNCDNVSPFGIQWTLIEDTVSRKVVDDNDRYRVLVNGSLVMKSALPGDAGFYTCSGDNSPYELIVQVPPVFTITPDSVVHVKAGDPLRLTCEATGEPAPTMRWMNVDKNMNVTIGDKFAMDRVEAKDEGNYECIAMNEAGMASKEFRIKVIGGEVDINSVSASQRTSQGITSIITDEDVYEAVSEARLAVEEAVQQTLDTIHSKSFAKSPGRLLKVARYPFAPESREAAKAIEVYQRSLEILKRKSESSSHINTVGFSYRDILSSNQLNVLAHLAGCEVGHRHHNLLQVIDCNSEICFHQNYRTYDGSCNNLQNPMWGTSLTAFLRQLPPIYEDGIYLPVGWDESKLYNGAPKPNPRTVSLSLSTKDITPDSEHTHMLMQWGQLIDHDLDHTLPSISFNTFNREPVDCSRLCRKTSPCYSIPIAENDPKKNRTHFGGRNNRDIDCIEVIRSSAFCGSGLTSVIGGTLMAREQVNQITSFIDGSMIYGSTNAVANDLRQKVPRDSGFLRFTSINGKDYLPFNADRRWPIDCQQDPRFSDFGCFLAGDLRANEQLGLLSMHILWMREHNRIALELKDVNPHWSGEKIYHEARKIVGAEIQHITYKHWLPKIFGRRGKKLLGEYEGYKDQVNPSISNVFATAALRFGHTLVNPFLLRLNETYQPTTAYKSNLPLHEAFFAPQLLIKEGGIDPLIRGLLVAPAKLLKPDQVINSELTEHLFEFARDMSLDLAAINIQRGRDHGLPAYNAWRKFCNLTEVQTFDDLKGQIKNSKLREKLESLYGHPGDIDIWVAGVAEDVLREAKVGPTFLCLLVDQFKRARDGDRFWYEKEGVFSRQQLAEIRKVSLSKIICHNGDNTRKITEDVFVVPESQQWVDCTAVRGIDFKAWATNGLTATNDCSHESETENRVDFPPETLRKLAKLNRLRSL